MKYLVICLTYLIGFIFTGCSYTSELTKVHLNNNEKDPNYLVIYYIHADADYLYHSPEGNPIRDNSKVLTTAFEVGETALSGEVIIYYQRSEKKLLGIFPRKSSRFFHYKNGQLINHVKYRHADKREPFLATEAKLMATYRDQNQTNNNQNYLLYYGHKIPSVSGKGYNQSLPGIDVNTVSFTKGIQNFLLNKEDRFNFVVLSTCNNGTPAMVELLIPFTDALLASPNNLHLSHIDSDRMKLLEFEPGINSLQLGRSLADYTFQRLDTTVQTTITLALYDLKEVRPYINTLTALTGVDKVSDRSLLFKDNVDCTEIYHFEPGAYTQGIETWYKPARFGRKSAKTTHSGWGCKPEVK